MTGREVGVGPWEGPWPSPQELATRYDEELLREGDRRNVVDGYRYWRHEAIVADLDTRRHPLHIAVENWEHDFNIGAVIRTANAMNVAAFHIVGRRRWNRRGAMVTDRYQHEYHHRDAAALRAFVDAHPFPAEPLGDSHRRGDANSPTIQPMRPVGPIIACENSPDAVPLETYDLPRSCLLFFGSEGAGLSPEALAVSDAVLGIGQFGSTRSMNAAAAAAIAMHAWVRRHVYGQRPGPETSPLGT